MPLPEKAIALAVEANRGQKDQSGAPYILHPLRVKLADLEDNLDVRRLPEVTEEGRERRNRYLAAYRRLRQETISDDRSQ